MRRKPAGMQSRTGQWSATSSLTLLAPWVSLRWLLPNGSSPISWTRFFPYYNETALGRKRWAIEAFFKTAKHRFGLHCFGQSTKLGVYRWLVLFLIAYLLVHWIDQWSFPPVLDWKVASDLALKVLFPSVVWLQLLRAIQTNRDIAAQYGFEITLKPLPKVTC
jgi:hypothetical protein